MNIKTRFAPSPTGFLHIGGARTALFAWLFAKHNKGSFIVRIEDTDLERSTKESIEGILEGLEWLGILSDQEPVLQTTRLSRYRQLLDEMIENNLAYYCECDQERLKDLRDKQLAKKLKPKYDNNCRDKGISKSENTVIRFRNPLNGKVVFNDLIFGEIIVNNSELDDLVLQRSDGMPTYNFAAAIDDYDMGISHVIRGDDHINNTPKQINILQSLKLDVPKFAHLPMILNENGKRMSKRYDAVNVINYEQEGFLPAAMLNYLVRLGWSKGDKELFSVQEMINDFSLSKVNTSPAIFSKDKLLWFNKHYIQNYEKINYISELTKFFKVLGVDSISQPPINEVVKVFAKRASTLKEMAESSLFLYTDDIKYNPESIEKFYINNIENSLGKVVEYFEKLSNWDVEAISSSIKQIIAEDGLKFPQLAQPIRIALTGDIHSPSIDQVIFLLGKSRTIARINNLIKERGNI